MPVDKTLQRCELIVLILISIFTTGCVPVAAPEPVHAPGLVTEAVTPTPEIFNPVHPSPTTSGSILPMTCQVTDLNVYINREWGYCFAYPQEYTLDESKASNGMLSLYGPALEDSPDPIHVSLELTAQPVAVGTDLSSLVHAYLTTFGGATVTLGTQSAPSIVFLHGGGTGL